MAADFNGKLSDQTLGAMRARAISSADGVALGVTARHTRTELEDGDAPGGCRLPRRRSSS